MCADHYLFWLDYVPIVGTLKNSVECVIAIVNGDYATAGTKALEAVVGAATDAMSFGAARVAESMVLKEGEKIFMNAVVKGGAGKAGVEISQYAGTKALRKAVLSRVRTDKLVKELGLKGKPPDSRETKKKSNRGEHVINNNVLKVFEISSTLFFNKFVFHQSNNFANTALLLAVEL